MGIDGVIITTYQDVLMATVNIAESWIGVFEDVNWRTGTAYKMQNKVLNRIQKLAISCAFQSPHRFRMGAVIFKKNKILGFGWNKGSKTHPKANTPFKSIHAEFDAILNSKEKIKGSSIYIHRLLRNNHPGLAKPCKFCEHLIKTYGIKEITFSRNS